MKAASFVEVGTGPEMIAQAAHDEHLDVVVDVGLEQQVPQLTPLVTLPRRHIQMRRHAVSHQRRLAISVGLVVCRRSMDMICPRLISMSEASKRGAVRAISYQMQTNVPSS